MPATSKVAAAVAAGYLLGRTKKLRLAITVGSLLAGGRLAGAKPGALLQNVTANPEIKKLEDQLRGRLLEAAKSAAANVATSRVEALTASLREPAPTSDEEAEDQADEEPTGAEGSDEAEEQSDRPRSGGGSAGSRRPAKKAPAAKKTAAKKTAAKKAPAKKSATGSRS